MATLDKEIKVIAVKGQRGYSSYEEAVANDYFSGTLEEWIETYATPENYVTRNEFKKVTQAEYDALEQAEELIPNCYYIITDDETYDELITRLNGIDTTITSIENDVTDIQGDITTIQGDIETLNNKVEFLENVLNYFIPNVTNANGNFDFSLWESFTTDMGIGYIDLITATVGQGSLDNAIKLTPTNSYKSIKTAVVEYLSGDSGYLGYSDGTIDETNNSIIFRAQDLKANPSLGVKSVYPPNYNNSSYISRTTTFKITITTVYNTEVTLTFTVSYKTNPLL